MAELIFGRESYDIMGACFEVYKTRGSGFTEAVYQECLALEFNIQHIPFVAQPKLELEYKGTKLDQYFKADFVCYGAIVVELKALPKISAMCRAQVLNYLHAMKFRLGIIVNFGHTPRLEYERIVL